MRYFSGKSLKIYSVVSPFGQKQSIHIFFCERKGVKFESSYCCSDSMHDSGLSLIADIHLQLWYVSPKGGSLRVRHFLYSYTTYCRYAVRQSVPPSVTLSLGFSFSYFPFNLLFHPCVHFFIDSPFSLLLPFRLTVSEQKLPPLKLPA